MLDIGSLEISDLESTPKCMDGVQAPHDGLRQVENVDQMGIVLQGRS
jgi:hypothetical protein